MAKLASQTLTFQLCKAVRDEEDEELNVLTDEAIAQLLEAIEALAGDGSVVVEVKR